MAEQIPSVRYAIAASASCHLANRLGNDVLKRQSLQFRVKATELLRQRLRSEGQAPELGSLASMLLLAQLDVCALRPESDTALILDEAVLRRLWRVRNASESGDSAC